MVRLPSLDPLRERPFRLLFVGRTLSGVGDAVVPIALTFAVLKHGSATDLGIVLGCEWGARVLFLLAGGVWADRLPRQLVMIGADALRAAVQALVEALEGLRAVRERRWIVAALGADLVFNFCFAAYFVLGPTVVEHHFNGARDWGLIMTAASIGGVVGAAIVLRVKARRPLGIAYAFSFLMPLQLLALAPPLPLPVLLLGSAAVFANVTVLNTVWVPMVQQHVPAHLLSRVESLG